MRGSLPLAALFLLLLGCSSAAPTPLAADAVELSGTWVLRAGLVYGRPILNIDRNPVTLELSATRLGGHAACNDYALPIHSSGRTLRPLQAGPDSTEEWCDYEANAVDMAYFRALPRLHSVEALTPADLVLVGPDVRLEFRAANADER